MKIKGALEEIRKKNIEDEDNINISDVIEVIQTTDPDFTQSRMFSGGGEISTAPGPTATGHRSSVSASRRGAYVKILEQPASKALRFRYECEGRSAGSIPGASSTPENKTFPAIQVVGHQGRAVVVVSCVTKDPPYRPHPHNLVGREGCRRGVCTLEVSPETMAVTFSNLGIQCVKKKDIEDALKVREEIRVDPFRTGFAHRNQPTSIDLNAVRLCFQVFLEGDNRNKFTVPLNPVVSDPIYDKKAMSDLVICKLSDCTCSVAGGKEVILLCEKVAKEDIQVRFYEENNGTVVWEGLADFQPSHVHKQVAISFRTPRYHTLEISEPIKVFIQLRRPSDGATSESLPFELLPLDAGRPPFWSLRRNLQKKGDYNTFSRILATDRLLLKKSGNSIEASVSPMPVLLSKNKIIEVEEVDDVPSASKRIVLETDESSIVPIDLTDEIVQENNEEKTLNDLLNQVAELDQIYSDTQARLQDITQTINDQVDTEVQSMDVLQTFDDSNTYSSLQLAFKNPIDIEPPILNIQGPLIEIFPQKREPEPEKLPPLPPKRVRKSDTPVLTRATSQGSFKLPKNESRSSSIELQRPKSQEMIAPIKKLPPTPMSTLPNPKKTNFFSKLFSKKPKKSASLSASKSSLNSNQDLTTPLQNPTENSSKISINNSLKDVDILNLDLTEAEHYALYTAIAPHATQSEFDEMSCYYSPVEAGKIVNHNQTNIKSTT